MKKIDKPIIKKGKVDLSKEFDEMFERNYELLKELSK